MLLFVILVVFLGYVILTGAIAYGVLNPSWTSSPVEIGFTEKELEIWNLSAPEVMGIQGSGNNAYIFSPISSSLVAERNDDVEVVWVVHSPYATGARMRGLSQFYNDNPPMGLYLVKLLGLASNQVSRVVLFDHRSSSDGGSFGIAPDQERNDLVRLVRQNKDRFPNAKFYLWGGSLGAAIVMDALLDLPLDEVKAIVLDSPVTDPKLVLRTVMSEQLGMGFGYPKYRARHWAIGQLGAGILMPGLEAWLRFLTGHWLSNFQPLERVRGMEKKPLIRFLLPPHDLQRWDEQSVSVLKNLGEVVIYGHEAGNPYYTWDVSEKGIMWWSVMGYDLESLTPYGSKGDHLSGLREMGKNYMKFLYFFDI